MASTLVVGSTGLVGSYILSTLLALPGIGSVHALARRAPKSTDSKLQAIVEPESSKWASKIATIAPPPSIYFSALGTTRAQAGGFENQYKIDHDLNLELAKAAKAAGVKVCVLISSSSAHAESRIPYSKMKGELDDAVKALDFEKTVILQPGLIVGTREDSRPPERIMRGVASLFGAVSGGFLKDSWAQDADVIGKAAVLAGLKALEGDTPKVWTMYGSDILTIARADKKA